MLDKPCCEGTKARNLALSPTDHKNWGEIQDVRWHEDQKIIVVEYKNDNGELNHRIIHVDKLSPFWPLEIEQVESPA